MMFLDLLTKHAALAAQAAAGTLDDAGRAELAKYTAAAEALQGKRALPGGLEVRVMDAAGFQAHVEAELAKGLDPDRLAVLKAAMDAVAAYQAAGADRFAVHCIKDQAPAAAAGPALDPTALAAMVEDAVAKAFDARFKAGVGTPAVATPAVVSTPDAAVATDATPAAKDEPAPEPTPEPVSAVAPEPTPEPIPEADPVAKGAEAGWYAGDWAAMVATEGQAAE